MTDKFHQRLECLLIDLEIAAGNIFRDNDTSEERPAVVSHVDAEIAELHRVIDNLRKGDELRGMLKAREMARDARSWRGQAETDAETIEEFAAEIAELEHVLDTYTDQRVCPACSSRRNIAGAYHGRRYCEACQHEWDVTP